MTGDHPCPINLLATQEIYANGNMETITENIPINISRNPSIMENVFIGADFSPEEIQIYMDLFKEFYDVFFWSYEEIPGIDPKIVDFMFNYFRIDTWNFLIRPGKNVAEFFEKICVNLNLFGGEIRSDEDILHDARVSGDVDRYSFSDSRHITLNINFLCS